MTRPPPHEPTEAEIQKAAYYLYLESGCAPRRELDHWFAAKELLRHHHGRDGGRLHGHHPPVSVPSPKPPSPASR